MPPKAGKLRKTPHGNAERNFLCVRQFEPKKIIAAYKLQK